jgi:1-acyl-sn-glycerol-3-phosphate acyltransferase
VPTQIQDMPQEAEALLELPVHNYNELSLFERFSVRICRFIAARPKLKNIFQWLIERTNAKLTYACVANIIEESGLEHVENLKPPGSVLLVANHRSFFDMFVASAVLYKHTSFLRRLFFPVRADFFHSHPIGLALNIFIAAGAMFPPIYRDRRRSKLNPISMAQMDYLLQQPNTLVGIHPEASRNKNNNPYEFLRTRSGVGQLVQNCPGNTLIIPYFMCGLSSDFLYEVKRNFGPANNRGPSIRIRFGKPIFASELNQDDSARDHAESLMDMIKELAKVDEQSQKS